MERQQKLTRETTVARSLGGSAPFAQSGGKPLPRRSRAENRRRADLEAELSEGSATRTRPSRIHPEIQAFKDVLNEGIPVKERAMAREAEKSAREGKQTTDDDASSSPKAGRRRQTARDPMTSASGGPAEEAKAPSSGGQEFAASFRTIGTES